MYILANSTRVLGRVFRLCRVDTCMHLRAVGNAGASGVSEAKMKKLLEEDKERIDFEEDHMVRLVSATPRSNPWTCWKRLLTDRFSNDECPNRHPWMSAAVTHWYRFPFHECSSLKPWMSWPSL